MVTRTELPPPARQTIEAFTASMQFAAMPAPAADGSYTFVFEHSGTLSLLATRDRKHIVMALGRMPVSDDETFIRRFFMGAALEALTSGPLHAGIAPDGACYYATVIAGEEFDLPTLESNLNQLFAAHEAVA